MTIKSDKWIRSKCMPYNFIIERSVIDNNNPHSTLLVIDTVFEYSHMTEPEIQEKIRQDSDKVTGIKKYRPITQNDTWSPMITPFVPGNVREENGKKIISYGTSSFGYDVRLSDEFKIFTNINSTVIDPLDFDHSSYVNHKGDFCIIPPNSYILGVTKEYFDIPRNVMVICVGKSTLARAGAIVNVTPIEPGFKGNIVIEISNSTPLPLKIYANQGIAQFMFFESDEECETSYADRDGKYQGQTGIVTPKV